MMDSLVAVHADDAGPVVAVVYPTGRIGGTDDPDLVRRIRTALADDYGVPYSPRFTGGLDGPATAHAPGSREWATVLGYALSRQGLVGELIGYGQDPHEDAGRTVF